MEIKKGKYQHYKGGVYEIIGVAKHKETLEELVIYLDLKGNLWARSRDNFLSLLKIDDKEVPRFKHLG